MATDFELLDAWRQGDRGAGNELFERYFDSVFRFFRNKVSQGAEDLVQQTFLACVQTRENFRKEASFRTYLFTAARSKLFTYLDRRRREGQAIEAGVTSIADLGVSPTGLIAQGEEQKLLLHALRRLPVDLQIALELYYFEKIRGPELARALDVPEGTVRSRLRRGREILRAQVAALAASAERVESTMSDLDGWASALRQQALGPPSQSRD